MTPRPLDRLLRPQTIAVFGGREARRVIEQCDRMTNPAPSILPGLGFRQRFPLLALILERFVLSLALLFAVSILIFGGLEALPGDFATTYLGQSATPQAVANIRQDLGLNRPVTTRYVEWLGNAVQGDFGTSWASKNSVSEQIGKRLGNSLFLAGFAAVISVPLAVGLGMHKPTLLHKAAARTHNHSRPGRGAMIGLEIADMAPERGQIAWERL